MSSLDDILAKREAAPAQETTQDQTTQAKPEGEAEQQETEQQSEAEGEQAAKDGKPAPIGAIRQAEREKATKRYTEQVADFERKLSDQNQAWERRFNTLVEKLAPKQEQQQAPDFYENPPAAVLHTVEPFLAEARTANLHNSRMIAGLVHGQDVVDAADAEFTKLYSSGQLDPADYQRIIRSPNIYDAAAQWHKRRQAQQEIGDDPAAYRAKLEAEIRAKLEVEAQAGQQDNGQQVQQRAVMPSNFATARNVGARSGPAWSGPKSLAEIFKR